MPQSQNPHTLLMIRPVSFGYNPETAASNSFQKESELSQAEVQRLALAEFDLVVSQLKEKEIPVLVFDDTIEPKKPDAIFPNNWISTHNNGLIVLYPMMAANRRRERRQDIVKALSAQFAVQEILDLSSKELEGKFLEGTGSIVFDHQHHIAYACRSPRTNEALLIELCKKIGYEVMVFDAVDEKGGAIYHTNVMMWIGEKMAAICLDAIRSEDDQEKLLTKLSETNHKVIAISYSQMNSLAGNMFEVTNSSGKSFLLMSESAHISLLPGQLKEMSKHAEPLIVSIPTIEKFGGGGIRCMVAGIYLPVKSL